MELLHWLLNFTLVPSAVGFLFFLVPGLWFLRSLNYVMNWLFPEHLENKVVVITGASSGIGEHMAYEYAKKGAKLTLAAKREELLREIGQRARSLGSPEVIVVPADVTKADDCKRIIDGTTERFHRLDHLVLCAGIAHSFLMEDVKTTDIRESLDVNFWGAVYPTFYALPWLRRSRGHIVVLSSVAAFLPYPRMALYNAAKAGIFNFFDTLRVELGTDVNITIAAPGWVESEMTAGKFQDAEGKVKFDQETRDMQVGPWPVEPVTSCAKAIVNGAVRRQRYVFIPYWYTTWLFYRIFAADIMDFFLSMGFVSPPNQKPLSKKVMDTTRADRILYPESIQKKAS